MESPRAASSSTKYGAKTQMGDLNRDAFGMMRCAWDGGEVEGPCGVRAGVGVGDCMGHNVLQFNTSGRLKLKKHFRL